MIYYRNLIDILHENKMLTYCKKKKKKNVDRLFIDLLLSLESYFYPCIQI